MKKFLKKAEGFTLVELIVVIAILGILAGVAVPAYTGYIKKAEQAADITELDAIKTAAQGALATYGEVTGIEVASEGAIKVTYKNAAGTAVNIDDILTADTDDSFDDDFKLYYGSAAPKLGSGTKGVWANGTWTIS